MYTFLFQVSKDQSTKNIISFVSNLRKQVKETKVKNVFYIYVSGLYILNDPKLELPYVC